MNDKSWMIESIAQHPEFYEKMDTPINVGPPRPKPELVKVLTKIINNLVFSQVKAVDAPCAASTHFNSALYDLLLMVPNYEPPTGEECKEVVVEAVTEINILKGMSDDKS